MGANQVCNLRDCSCSDGHCASIASAAVPLCDCGIWESREPCSGACTRVRATVADIAVAVKADIPNHRIRERLQVLEAWKLDADETELKWIEGHAAYLRYLLDPHRIPTSSHEPGWSETRRRAGEYHDPEEMIR